MLGSLQTNPACGDNPCTFWDDIWVRDACLNYLRCADPENILVTGVDQGTGAMIGQAAGEVVGGTINNLVTTTVETAFVNPTTGNISWPMILLIGGAGLFLFKRVF